jgi:hypothetical protein
MSWRQGSESNDAFTDYQPQYPDLQGNFNTAFAGVQDHFGTTRPLQDLTRHIPVAYSVIEEIVEGFVEGFLGTRPKSLRNAPCDREKPRTDWKKDLQTRGEGRDSRKRPTLVRGKKPNGKYQIK